MPTMGWSLCIAIVCALAVLCFLALPTVVLWWLLIGVPPWG